MNRICGIFGKSSEGLLTKMVASMNSKSSVKPYIFQAENIRMGVTPIKPGDAKKSQHAVFEDETGVCVFFDGYLYNHDQLRSFLERQGCKLRSASDAELAAQLYRQKGESFMTLLKGTFSLVLWDGDKLLLGRDRLGFKRLFYTEVPGDPSVIFGSEIKSLFQHSEVPRAIDEESLYQQSVLAYIYGLDRTLFKDIKQVPPGCLLVVTPAIDGGGKRFDIQVNRYYDLPEPAAHRALEKDSQLIEFKERLKTALENTCQRYIEKEDIPHGILLSGGLDSSFLASLWAKHSPAPLKTFSVSDSSGLLDLEFSRMVSRTLGTEHMEMEIGFDDFIEAIPLFFSAFENITLGGGMKGFNFHADLASFILSSKVSRYTDIAICGEGSDELFGGYPQHHYPGQFQQEIKESMASVAGSPYDIGDRIEKWIAPPKEKELQMVFDFLLRSHLTNYHLWAGDQGGVANGLDVKLPYLDQEVFDIAAEIPVNWRLHLQIPKYLLKKIAEDYFKDTPMIDILYRKKLALPSGFVELSKRFYAICEKYITPAYRAKHPYGKYLKTSVETLLFDVFYYIFIIHGGIVPADFKLDQIYTRLKW